MSFIRIRKKVNFEKKGLIFEQKLVKLPNTNFLNKIHLSLREICCRSATAQCYRNPIRSIWAFEVQKFIIDLKLISKANLNSTISVLWTFYFNLREGMQHPPHHMVRKIPKNKTLYGLFRHYLVLHKSVNKLGTFSKNDVPFI